MFEEDGHDRAGHLCIALNHNNVARIYGFPLLVVIDELVGVDRDRLLRARPRHDLDRTGSGGGGARRFRGGVDGRDDRDDDQRRRQEARLAQSFQRLDHWRLAFTSASAAASACGMIFVLTRPSKVSSWPLLRAEARSLSMVVPAPTWTSTGSSL